VTTEDETDRHTEAFQEAEEAAPATGTTETTATMTDQLHEALHHQHREAGADEAISRAMLDRVAISSQSATAMQYRR
jgi:hypothetical protein